MVTPLEPRTEEEWRTHPLALAMTEAALQANLTGTGRSHGLLQRFGWRAYHTHDSRRSQAGFPDVCAVRVRDGRLLLAELKSQKGRVRPEQREWIADLEHIAMLIRAQSYPTTDYTAGVEVYTWRPSHWLSGEIERVLR